MIPSPARKHFARKQAEKQAVAVDSNNLPTGSAYELMKAQLIEHRRELHDIQSIEKKIEFKRQILPFYADYVYGVLDANQGANDDIITTIMVWCFDCGELAEGLMLAKYALAHKLEMPDQYQRSVPAIIAEESATSAMILLSANAESDSITEVLAQLKEAEALTADADMHDQIRAKLHKAIGLYSEAAGDLENALTHLERALELNANAGVKKNIQQIKSAIKKAAEAE